MEKSITFRFYKVMRHDAKIPKFADVLSQIAAIKKKSDRERQLGADFTVRLEEFEEDGPTAVVGEIIRVQNTNMPSEVLANGRQPLTTLNPLGHGITFRFNSQTSVLCIQYDPRIASPGKLLDYVAICFDGAVYDIKPMIKPEAWEKFNKSDVTRISIKVAQPDALGNVAAAHNAAIQGFRDMAAAYDAPSVKVEMSMGHHKGYLNTKVKGLAKVLATALAQGKEEGGATLESLRAVTYVDDARDVIDLIEDRLKAKEELQLDDRDPEKNYKIKKAYIKKVMKEQGV